MCNGVIWHVITPWIKYTQGATLFPPSPGCQGDGVSNYHKFMLRCTLG